MTTNSLTLPFFPGPSGRSEPHTGRAAGTDRRRYRLPGFLRAMTRDKTPRDGLSTRRIERHLRRLARRGGRIGLGTPEVPYEPLAQDGVSLAALRRFDGLAVTITTRSAEILEQLDLLIELDQRHAVTVDILIASVETGSPDLEESLRTVSALASHGMTTRLVLTDLPGLPLSTDATSGIRRLFEAAKECRAFDVAVVSREVETEESSRLLRCLRLEMGFPRTAPGRG